MKDYSNPKLEAAFTMIRELFAEAVSEAGKDAVAAWLAEQAQQHSTIKAEVNHPRTARGTQSSRAPKGVARQLVEKVMKKVGKQGVSPSAIQDYAETAEERMVSYSAIRLELYKGAESKRYYSDSGKWYPSQK